MKPSQRPLRVMTRQFSQYKSIKTYYDYKRNQLTVWKHHAEGDWKFFVLAEKNLFKIIYQGKLLDYCSKVEEVVDFILGCYADRRKLESAYHRGQPLAQA